MPEARIGGAPNRGQHVRSKVPTFNRDRIVIEGPIVKRSWRERLAVQVCVGDTVAGFGVVTQIDEIPDIPEEIPDDEINLWEPWWILRFHNALGDAKEYYASRHVLVFTGPI